VEGRATRVLVNFATLKFYAAQQRNAETAVTVGGFDEVICYGPRDIDRQFRVRNRSLLRSRIGAGYWLWKPYFIKRALDLLSQGDFLFYCDSGSHFVDRIDPLIELAARTQQPVIPFELIHLERCYTKRETLILMGCDAARFTDTGQRQAGLILFQKSAFAEKFVDEFLELAQDPRLITDTKSRLGPDYADFVAHRHDQSIFSLLTKRYGLAAYRDPSEYGNDLREEYPASTYGQLIDLTRSRTSRPAGLAWSWWKRLRARPKPGERGLMMRRL
jgi:hypothetical protein